MQQKRLLLLTLLLAAVLGACGAPPSSARTQLPAPEPQMVVHIENRDFEDAAIYLMRGTTRIRLGVVDGFSVRSFSLPAAMVGRGTEIQLFVEPIVSRQGYTSQVFALTPGQAVRWSINARTRVSNLSVWW